MKTNFLLLHHTHRRLWLDADVALPETGENFLRDFAAVEF